MENQRDGLVGQLLQDGVVKGEGVVMANHKGEANIAGEGGEDQNGRTVADPDPVFQGEKAHQR